MHPPRKINLGSGKDYRMDCINVDVNPLWNPDFLSLDGLEPNNFDEIIANDVLEHVSDLVVTMTNCLQLLRVGGIMNIIVPYDLSLGAWSDPTHLRAFNERSWIYYCDWFWYLDWQTHRFKLNKLDYQIDESLPTMRQICAMNVELEKIELTEEEKMMAQNYYARENK